MNTAKMIADSTQSDMATDQPTRMHHKKGKKHSKSKKVGKKTSKKRSSSHKTDLLNDPDLDLSKNVKDIGAYIKDRQEMLDQMFNSVQGNSMQRALPDILKDMKLDELKQRCLEQLIAMSKKRIKRILNGDLSENISSSGTEDETTDEEMKDVETEQRPADSTSQGGTSRSIPASKSQAQAGGGESDGEWRPPPADTDYGSEYEEIEVEEEVEVTDEDAEEELILVDVEEEVPVEIEIKEEFVEEEDRASIEGRCSSSGSISVDKDIEQEVAEQVKELDPAAAGSFMTVLTKNQMELLELEMRARAIKAMLKKHQGAASQAGNA